MSRALLVSVALLGGLAWLGGCSLLIGVDDRTAAPDGGVVGCDGGPHDDASDSAATPDSTASDAAMD